MMCEVFQEDKKHIVAMPDEFCEMFVQNVIKALDYGEKAIREQAKQHEEYGQSGVPKESG